jgi:hypothetical protein
LDFVPEGVIVGIVEGMLAVVEMPKLISLAFDDEGNSADPQDLEYLEKEMDRLESQGFPEEELREKIVELIEPKGKTILKLYNLKNGEIANEINLTDGTWQIRGILVHPSEQLLIAHQTDKMFAPSKQRFIAITPSENPSTRVIFEEDLQGKGEQIYFSLLINQGSTFLLGNGGDWIIGMRGAVLDSQNNKTYMRNIFTGEEYIICSSYCTDVAVFNPYSFSIKY